MGVPELSRNWRVLDGRGIYAHPRREARPRVHLRYRSATAMTSDYVPRVNWLEGRPTRKGKGGAGGVAQPIAAWRNYRVVILSLVCGYVSAVFIEVATESGRIGRLISDRITAEVSQMSRSDFRIRAGCQLGRRKDRAAFAGPSRPGESTSTTHPSALPR